MAPSEPNQSQGGLSRRSFLKTTGLVGAGIVLGPTILGSRARAAEVVKGAGPEDSYYTFVNKTNGKWKDEEIFWSKDMGKSWHTIKESAANGGNGRIYICMGKKPEPFGDDWGAYWDFLEYNSNGKKWIGNTTQVDAWCLPITLEIGSHKVGIKDPRTKMFEEFKKEAPKEFKSCVLGDFWIVSPFKADMGTGKPFEKYFEKYVDGLWDKYLDGVKTPSGKYVGKSVKDGGLTFTPVEGGTGKNGGVVSCASKPNTKNILLGEGVLGGNPGFCAAFNRGVADDPADWRNVSKFYQKEPYNWYSKFLHKHSIDNRAYGFCYDDYAEQAAYFAGEGDHLIVTFYWD
jgi:hypothetical protein